MMHKLKTELGEQAREKAKFKEQIQWLQSREEEVIKRLDLNEIDLVTERLEIYGVDVNKPSLNPNPQTHPIPVLDMEKIKLMKEQDEYEYEEEEEEEEDHATEQQQYLQDSSIVCSENEREDELRKRKEQVISLLNQTFHDDK